MISGNITRFHESGCGSANSIANAGRSSSIMEPVPENQRYAFIQFIRVLKDCQPYCYYTKSPFICIFNIPKATWAICSYVNNYD